MKNIDFAVPAAAQFAGPGASPLSAAMPGARGVSLPVAWCAGAAGLKDPRQVSRQAADIARVQALAAMTTSMKTNTRKHVYTTRVNANGYGASGPYPAREPA